MYHFYNRTKSFPHRFVAMMLVLTIVMTSFIYPSFADGAVTTIDTWTFDLDQAAIHWSESNSRWEVKLTADQFSLSEKELYDTLALPAKIYAYDNNTATPSEATVSEAALKDVWPVAFGSNLRASKATVSETDIEDDELPDYDLIDDRDSKTGNRERNIASSLNGNPMALATVSNASSVAMIEIPITWDLNPLCEYLATINEMSDSETDANDITATTSNAALTAVVTESLQQTAEITIRASLNSDSYRLSSDAIPIAVTVILASENTFDEALLEANSIETESPDGLTLNLFDYWNTEQTASDHFGWGTANNQKEWATEFWKKNIGKNHVLQFMGAESNEKFGDWNSWIGSSKSAYQGLVQRKLVDGYPALDISDEQLSATTELSGRNGQESLSYLFDPEEEHDGKESFKNVKGLLSKNGAGYTYSCKTNFAEFVSTPNAEDSDGYYRVYNTWGIRTNNGQNGQYFPFASMDKAFTEKDGVLTPNNIDGRQFTHFFGLSGSMEFTKPKDGIVRFNSAASHLHFNISGTDDIWIFVDDVLVGDGGGNSDEKVIDIDFATGEVTVRRAANNTEATTHSTTIKECFELAGADTNSFSGETFADNTTHTLKFFQLERGSNASFLGLDFNTLNLNELNQAALAKNKIQTVSPENIHIDLHDYWNTGKYDKDYYVSWQSGIEGATEFWKHGIGKNHILQFANTIKSLNQQEDTKDGFGSYNEWTGATGMAYSGLVKSKLEDGYPVLNISESQMANAKLLPNTKEKRNESLAYLFDPDVKHEGKESFENVNGIFHEEDGFYVYNGRDNYAEFMQTSDHTGRFNVYNIPGVKNNLDVVGQFFPFNAASEVFNVNPDGTIAAGDTTCQTDGINHFFGLNMTIDFEQPKDGMVLNSDTSEPMQFFFTGDDDVWVFVDGVLISDLGGLHDELYTTIDFSTGEIICDRTYDATDSSRKVSTIREQFEKAGEDTSSFRGDTFADYTAHTMQFFYLERGSNASNLTMKLNLQYRSGNRIRKMDQDGNGLGGATFALYAANRSDDGTFTIDPSYPDPLLDDITVSDTGVANINRSDGIEFDFSSHDHYILREKRIPDGYSGVSDIWITSNNKMPADLGLQIGSATLYTENQFDTGVSIAHTMSLAGNFSDLNMFDGTNTALQTDPAEKLILMAVPYTRNLNDDTPVWKPMYGSEQQGYWCSSTAEGDEDEAIVEAMIGSIFEHYRDEDAADWTFSYDDSTAQIKATISPLPYVIDRYGQDADNISTGKDLMLRYYYLDLSSISSMKTLSASERKDYIASMIKNKLAASNDPKDIRESVHSVAALLIEKGAHAERLSKDNIIKRTQADIMIPNRERKLIVEKKNEEGKPLANAEFSIYATKEDALKEVNALYVGKTGENGKLEFTPQPADTEVDGSGIMHARALFCLNSDGSERHYYLKETKAPAHYSKNETIVVLTATEDGISADAGDAGNKVRVKCAPGILVSPLRKNATGVDRTLKTLQWSANGENFLLTYEQNGIYKELPADGNTIESSDSIAVSEGTIACSYRQSDAGWQTGNLTGKNLAGKDLSNLFAHETIVEVTDSYKYASLKIDKHINEQYAPFGDATFLFEVSGNGRVYRVAITIPKGKLDGSASINLEYGYDYQIKEIQTSRYKPAKTPVKEIENAVVHSDGSATALLSSNTEAEIAFYNEMTQYEKFSHAATMINQVSCGSDQSE